MALRLEATDTDGEPVADVDVTWRVREGDGLLGDWFLDQRGGSGPDLDTEVVRRTDGTGRITIWWELGPETGSQQIEASAEGADPITHAVEAAPGAVLAGVWRLSNGEDEGLPSDTFRVHAVWYEQYLAELEERHLAGEEQRLYGVVRLGPGVDENWIFHLDARSVEGVPPETGGMSDCIRRSPRREEALERSLSQAWLHRFCPWIIELVAIEDVPEAYLDTLADG